MSNFLTRISVEPQIDIIKSLLPPESNVERITFDPAKQELEIEWECGRLVTPFRYALEFSRDDLEKQQLPRNVKTEKEAKAIMAAIQAKPQVDQAAAERAEKARIEALLAKQAENKKAEEAASPKRKPLTRSQTRRKTDSAT